MIPECPRSGETRNRTQCHYGQVAEPNQNCFGLLSEIKTLIKNEPFTDHYTIIPGKELGRGKFAVVRKCVEKCTGQEYAAKFMRKRRKGQDCRLEIIHEVAVLELATASQRVVNLHQVYEMASEMVLVLQFAAGGEIFNQCVAERDEAFIEEDVKRVLRQILEESPSSTEQRGALDIKFSPTRPSSSNAAVQWSCSVYIYLSNCLSLYVSARSIGVLTYVMLTGTSPFLGEDKQETFLNISQINVSYQEDELEHVDQAAIAFIKLLLVKEPQNRATAEECLQHQWLQPKEKREAEATVEVKETISPTKCTSEPANPESHIRGEEEEGPETEELIVMAAYTLGHCRQSTDKEVMAPDQKAISKRFKFEEPFSALQEVPGEFIY
nr:serine/threonine-protein kinase 17A [Salvelinus alpinus]